MQFKAGSISILMVQSMLVYMNMMHVGGFDEKAYASLQPVAHIL